MTATGTGSGHIIDKRFDELSALEFHDIMALRCDVFVVEQACAYHELDGRDIEPGTRHVWIAGDVGVAAYARSLDDGNSTTRIGRVVASLDHRGNGYAKRLVKHLIDANANTTLVLDAQSYLVGWYEALGFAASGPEFVEDGIPHVPMQRA